MNSLEEYTAWFESLSEEDQLYWEYGWFEDEEEDDDDHYYVCKDS